MLAASVCSYRRSGAALLGVAVLLAGCATHTREPAAKPARPQVVTVPHLQDLLERGEAVGVLLSEIQHSGTVYRLTTQQRADLRASGMPVAVLGFMQNEYEQAVRKHPELETSDERWLKIGDFWYGGLPAGWPREWLASNP